MSDHSDSPNASVTTAYRVFVDDTVSRVFVGETVWRVSVGDTTLEETLRGVAELANAAIGGSDMVGVTMLMAGRPRTASTDDTVSKVDAVQYRSGIGPCLDACADRQVRRVDSTDHDDRWPAFSRAAAARGILSTMSVPLVAHHEAIGALSCYSRTATAFSADDERVAAPFALAAAMALAYWDARHSGERLGLTLESPAAIEQAKGILMAAQGCGPSAGSTWLRLPHGTTGTFVVDVLPGCDN
jgi:transcriptional regulator with GAF, ATPase, and Fis domain